MAINQYSKLRYFIIYGLLISAFTLLAFTIYGNILNSPFLFDDWIRISNNPHVRLKTLCLKDLWQSISNEQSSANRPVSNLTFALNYYFHQYNTIGYHIVNIIIHIINSILLFYFLTLLFNECSIFFDRAIYRHENGPKEIFIPFFTSLIWMVHPLHTNSVTYIVQRMNSMTTLFYLLSFILFIKGRIVHKKIAKRHKSRSVALLLFYLTALLAWIISLGCKQNTAMLPVFIILFEFYFYQNYKREWFISFRKISLVTCCIIVFLGLLYVDFKPFDYLNQIRDFLSNQYTYTERLLSETRVIIYYLSLIFYPNPERLTFDYDFPVSHSLTDPFTTLVALLTILVLILFSIHSAKKKRILSFSIHWFFGNLLIESSFVPISIINEYRTYLPSMLVALIFVILLMSFIKSKQMATILLSLAAMTLATWTYQRNDVWKNEISILKDCVKKSPRKSRPHANLAAYLLNSDIDAAEKHAQKAIESQISDVNVYLTMGQIYRKKNELEKAVNIYLTAIRHKPNDPRLYYELGITCMLMHPNKTDVECYKLFQNALSIDSNFEAAQYALGKYFFDRGDTDKALLYLKKTVNINPFNASAFFLLGAIYERLHEDLAAEENYKKALQLDYEVAKTSNNLGVILLKNNRLNESEKNFLKALELEPDYPDVYNNLGLLMERKGKTQTAKAFYRKAISLKPDFIGAYNNLGILYFRMNQYDESINCFQKALEIAPDRKDIRYNLDKVILVKKESKTKNF